MYSPPILLLSAGELGDYDPMTCRTGYLSEYQFFPGQVCMLDKTEVCHDDPELNLVSQERKHYTIVPFSLLSIYLQCQPREPDKQSRQTNKEINKLNQSLPVATSDLTF